MNTTGVKLQSLTTTPIDTLDAQAQGCRLLRSSAAPITFRQHPQQGAGNTYHPSPQTANTSRPTRDESATRHKYEIRHRARERCPKRANRYRSYTNK